MPGTTSPNNRLLLPLLPPPVALTGNPVTFQIVGGFLVMAAIVIWTGRNLHLELSREIDSSLRNKALLELLSKASAELRHLNTQLKEKTRH
jgi:hypothetical protein